MSAGVLLALDTSTAVASAAVRDVDPASAPAVSATREAGNRHAEVLTPLVRSVLSDAGAGLAQVSRIAVGVGPGPFTGLRVGLVTALTLGIGYGAEVLGVCSLDVIALAAARSGTVDGPELLVVTDARRREVYWARYTVGSHGAQRVAGPAVDEPAAVSGSGSTPTVGAGALLYPDVFGSPVAGAPLTPDAAVLADAVAAAALPLLAPQPLYLRRPDARPAGPVTPAPGIRLA